jgi:hypothetical protein
MIKRTTLSADESLIEEARAVAKADQTTLNALFRQWLAQYVHERRAQRALQIMERIGRYASSGGRNFNRTETNERQ